MACYIISDSAEGKHALSKKLINVIKTFNPRADWCNFEVLHFICVSTELYQYNLCRIFGSMADTALLLPTLLQDPLPLLKQEIQQSVTLSQRQIHSLLCNAFFCTFPKQDSGSEGGIYPDMNFIRYAIQASQYRIGI